MSELLSPTCLSTLAAAKIYFGIATADTSRDDQIMQAINAASDDVRGLCRRTTYGFAAQAVSEQRTAQGNQEMVLGHCPVVGITQLLTGVNDDGSGGSVMDTTYYRMLDSETGRLFLVQGFPDSRLANSTAVYNSPRMAAYTGGNAGSIAGDSILAYEPDPYAVRYTILVDYTAGWVLPQYQPRCTLTSGSAVVPLTVDTTTNLVDGMPVTGKGVPSGATVASVDSDTQVTLSAAVTYTGTTALTFHPISGIILAQRLPNAIAQATHMLADRTIGLTWNRGVRSVGNDIMRVQYYQDVAVDSEVVTKLRPYLLIPTG